MSDIDETPIDASLVQLAVRIARARGEDVANVPLTSLAAAAGISRSTLIRRLGGSRRALDRAIMAAGIDPGGRTPVRERAISAAGLLMSEQGLAAATLEAVADAADCSVHSLYATFGGRDGLLTAVYEANTPLFDIEKLLADRSEDLEDMVYQVVRALAAGLQRKPRVAPAMLADAFARPEGPVGRLIRQQFPRALETVGGWLRAEIAACRIRPIPELLLLQQLLGPILLHVLSRAVFDEASDLDDTCRQCAALFVAAVGTPGQVSVGASGA